MEVFVLASGPSLTAEDVERVRHWRTGERQVYVVNNTWELAPWADLLFAGDASWIERYGESVTFEGLKVTAAKQWPPGWSPIPAGFDWLVNSGAGAVCLAVRNGATAVYMLGFDCKKNGNRAHWHPAHSGKLKSGRALKDAPNIDSWPETFHRAAQFAKGRGAKVVNCSRVTILKCFARASLESVLGIDEAMPIGGNMEKVTVRVIRNRFRGRDVGSEFVVMPDEADILVATHRVERVTPPEQKAAAPRRRRPTHEVPTVQRTDPEPQPEA